MLRKYSLWLILVLLGLVTTCQADPIETPTPTIAPPTPTIEPSPTIDWFPRTATPSPVLSPTSVPSQATRISDAEESLIVSDDFSDTQYWQTQSSDTGTVAYETNALSFATNGGKQTVSSLSEHILPAQFFLEINLDALMCSPEDQYGLVLWNNSQSGTFRLWFNCAGQVKLDRVLPSGTSQLVLWQAGRRLQPGSPAFNRIGVWSRQGELEVFVNDTSQFIYPLYSEPTGRLGVITQTGGDLPMTVRVSDLEISEP